MTPRRLVREAVSKLWRPALAGPHVRLKADPTSVLKPLLGCAAVIGVTAFVPAQTSSGAAITVRDGVYSAEQAKRGRTTYDGKCASCHDGGTMGPELWGEAFLANWNGKTLNAFFTRIQTTMPEDSPGSLSENEALDVIAYVVQTNGFPAGEKALPTAGALSTITFVSNK
jgi:S-disulfanyl-L-cysteine oxidoreductase SoxD